MASSLFDLPQPNPVTDGPVLRRRALLALAAAAVAAGGCALARHGTPAAPVLLADSDLFSTVPGLGQAFAATHRSPRFVPYTPGTQGVLPSGAAYWLSPLGTFVALSAAGLVALDGALRADNFDPGALVAGGLDAYRAGGHQVGLPVYQDVLAVRYRRDVFAAAGLALPAADWTLADFEAACAAIAALLAAGRAPQIGAVLAGPGNTTGLQDTGLPVAFALGFGGTVAAGGRFALDAAARAGLAALVDLLHRYSGGQPVNADQATGLPAAMVFDTWVPAARVPAPWAYARLPRLPVRPVVVTGPVGWGVHQGRGLPDRPEAAAAAVAALLWLYRPQGQAPLVAAGHIPVLAAAEAQTRFWNRQGTADQAVGDWAHFVPVFSGWPAVPTFPYLTIALTQAVGDPSGLPARLDAAIGGMNTALPTAVS